MHEFNKFEKHHPTTRTEERKTSIHLNYSTDYVLNPRLIHPKKVTESRIAQKNAMRSF